MARLIVRFLRRAAALAIVLAVGFFALLLWSRGSGRPPGDLSGRVDLSPAARPPAPGLALAPAPVVSTPQACATPASAAAAARANGASLPGAQWSVFGRPEPGWAVYAPLVAQELGSPCRPDQAGFAEALGHWQATHGLPADGVMTAQTLKALDVIWLRRRPFVLATQHGVCPPPPPDALLGAASPQEGYLGKTVRLQVQALGAYRRLVAAARAALPEAAADPRLLTLVSGYRGPAEEAARCAKGGCGSPGVARCSAHRTGMAMDLFLGSAPGYASTSSDDVNRAAQSQSPAYRWLVANADRFGFAPYPFEPWHWEYIRGGLGEP